MTLEELEINKIGMIDNLNTNNSLKRRLLDLGMIQGTKIKPVFKSPSGSPKAYEIRGSLIAIRSEDAKKIEIKI